MIPITVVDAFTSQPFSGNPAAVCMLERWPNGEWLQLVAREMNLSETAFLVPLRDAEFELRWLTPTVEVALCGHATLAAAHAIWELQQAKNTELRFQTRSGCLSATRLPEQQIALDFPQKPALACHAPRQLFGSLGITEQPLLRNEFDYLIELDSEASVRAIRPNFQLLRNVDCRGVIVTARAEDPRFDFVSRFFAPAVGVDEDPVTGSAHCCLAHHWNNKLTKQDLVGYQASLRGGIVRMHCKRDRVKLIGEAITVLKGHLLTLPPT